MRKTDDEWMDELLRMEQAPNPDTPEKAARADEMLKRHIEIFNYLYSDGPEPDPDWKPAHPPKDEEERLRDQKEWFERTSPVMMGGLQG